MNCCGEGLAAPATSGAAVSPLEWKFSQVFGERTAGEEVQEIDVISAIEFDRTGDHLATGDCGGRVVLFERTDIKDHGGHRRDLERMDYSISGHPEFRYKTEFQSHKSESDYNKNMEIKEKINKIRWCQTANGALFLLSTNDKTIKYWKVTGQETSLVARCRRLYANAHDYYINSISNNSGGETFLSADDLRINLWNLEISNQSFNIVDVKPVNMEDLTEVITSAEFHPTHCNMLAYSSSVGSIRLIDLRQSALCDTHSKLFEEQEAPGSRSFFTEAIASTSDMKFAQNGRHILSRDYMTLKLWDINMDSGPVATFQVHEYLRPMLCDLYKNDTFQNDSYENESIFDKFECCLSGDGHRVATGSYSNLFRVFGCSEGSTEATTLEASKNPLRRQVQTPARPSRSLGNLRRVLRQGMCFHCNIKGADNSGADADNSRADANGNSFDFTTKLLHLAWHPSEDLIACAASDTLYMYYA
ncbi:unnamed protein product [Malus baccata var. baccata]